MCSLAAPIAALPMYGETLPIIGMVSRELKADEKGSWRDIAWRDGVTLIVHSSNKVASLDAAQIQGDLTR